MEHKTHLSASKIKTLQGCSFLYYAKYVLHLPDPSNKGAKLGWVAHLLFECLGDPRHRRHYNRALKYRNIYKVKCLKLLVKKHFKRLGITEREDAVKLNAMVIAGLGYDFFGKEIGRPTKAFNELPFDLECNENGKSYRIKGFIDKLFLYKSKCKALIRDFKTSKKSFDGKDLDDNIQHQMYVLAVRKLYPDFLKVSVEFPFLQLMPDIGKKAVVKMDHFSDEDVDAFEHFLTEIQKAIDEFSPRDAQSSMAIHKGFPTDGSFSGKLLCGFDSRKGDLKKDGTPKWGCPAKWGFQFYSVRDKDNKILKTYFLDELANIEYDHENGEKICVETYKGCPAWNRHEYLSR